MPRDEPTVMGVVGQQWRVDVSPAGAISPWGSTSPEHTLNWFVAADDRWHTPAAEAAVRQSRIDGTPVLETRMRIPDGDAVQRVWAVADRGGVVVVEFTNDSPLPMAVALTGPAVATSRPPSDVAAQGIDLPDDAIVLPVGHHATVRVAIDQTRHDRFDPSTLPDADMVVRGWRTIVDSASRLDLPDETLVAAVVAARCDLLLVGPVDENDDPAGYVLDVAELVRLGDDAGQWLPFVARVAEQVARHITPDTDGALRATARLATAAGDARAAADVERLLRHTRRGSAVAESPTESFAALSRRQSVGRFVADVESRLVSSGVVLPGGIPTTWLGTNFEFHDVPSGTRSALGLAVRWHGQRPAVLWEQRGQPVELSAPDIDANWSTSDMSGEALWLAPHTRPGLAVSAEGQGFVG